MKLNPGCRIPVLPEKTIWANLSINNNSMLEQRKKLIEEYLNYISHHQYLRQNAFFVKFISAEYNRKEYSQKNFIERLYNMKSYLPNLFNSEKTFCYTTDSNAVIQKERDNLIRLYKGLNELNCAMEEYKRLNEEQSNSMKRFLFSLNSMQNFSLDFKVNKEENQNEKEEMQTKYFSLFRKTYEKKEEFTQNIQKNILLKISSYLIEIKSLIDIFDRKEKEDQHLKNLKKANLNSNNWENAEEIRTHEIFVATINSQLLEEIKLFKIERENDLLQILQNFFKDKASHVRFLKQIE